jgi:hypothetical protein
MADKQTHLVIATPAYGGLVSTVYTASILKLQHALQKHPEVSLTVLMPSGDALVPRTRQDLIAHFLGMETSTHLLFVDSDIGFEPQMVFRFLAFNADVMAGVYPTKRVDWEKVAALAKEGRTDIAVSALSYVMEFENPQKIAAQDGFAQVKYAGAGFLMIRRGALEKMTAKYADLKYTRLNLDNDPLKGSPHRCALFNCIIDQATGIYLSEDYSFCRRWKETGGEVWADLQSRLTHVGPIAFEGNAATQFGAAKT